MIESLLRPPFVPAGHIYSIFFILSIRFLMRDPVDMLVPVAEGPRCECGALLRTVFRQVSLKKINHNYKRVFLTAFDFIIP
jgi:hypothetical protein